MRSCRLSYISPQRTGPQDLDVEMWSRQQYCTDTIWHGATADTTDPGAPLSVAPGAAARQPSAGASPAVEVPARGARAQGNRLLISMPEGFPPALPPVVENIKERVQLKSFQLTFEINAFHNCCQHSLKMTNSHTFSADTSRHAETYTGEAALEAIP